MNETQEINVTAHHTRHLWRSLPFRASKRVEQRLLSCTNTFTHPYPVLRDESTAALGSRKHQSSMTRQGPFTRSSRDTWSWTHSGFSDGVPHRGPNPDDAKPGLAPGSLEAGFPSVKLSKVPVVHRGEAGRRLLHHTSDCE